MDQLIHSVIPHLVAGYALFSLLDRPTRRGDAKLPALGIAIVGGMLWEILQFAGAGTPDSPGIAMFEWAAGTASLSDFVYVVAGALWAENRKNEGAGCRTGEG